MKNNKLFLSVAGSGKTTFLVKEAITVSKHARVLITTYTEENGREIRNKFYKLHGSIPENVTVQTWFSFLLKHGVRPYQGIMHDNLYNQDIKGMILVNKKSGFKFQGRNGRPVYWGENDFFKYYFTPTLKIYSDKISKFVFNANQKGKGVVISRLENIYDHVFIDEVQDLAGFDLELIKLLFKSKINTILVGDPRQVTYLTHNAAKHRSYSSGRIKEFLQEKCKSLLSESSIDEEILKKSHRNNAAICELSSKLYPNLPFAEPCNCESCRHVSSVNNGVFFVRSKDVEDYLDKTKAMQLRWNKSTKVNMIHPAMNFGESKGKTFDHAVIYPTPKMLEWFLDSEKELQGEVCAKCYVALTRARHSVAIVYDYDEKTSYDSIEKYEPEVYEKTLI